MKFDSVITSIHIQQIHMQQNDYRFIYVNMTFYFTSDIFGRVNNAFCYDGCMTSLNS